MKLTRVDMQDMVTAEGRLLAFNRDMPAWVREIRVFLNLGRASFGVCAERVFEGDPLLEGTDALQVAFSQFLFLRKGEDILYCETGVQNGRA